MESAPVRGWGRRGGKPRGRRRRGRGSWRHIQPIEPDTNSDGPSAFVEFIDNNQKEIGFGDQDFDEAARSLGMEYDEDTFNAQEEIRLKRQRRRQSAGEQYNQIEVQRHSVSRVNQREVLDTWDHYKEHCERPAKYRETVDVQEKASVVRQKIRQFMSLAWPSLPETFTTSNRRPCWFPLQWILFFCLTNGSDLNRWILRCRRLSRCWRYQEVLVLTSGFPTTSKTSSTS